MNEITRWGAGRDDAVERRGRTAELIGRAVDVKRTIASARQRIRVDMQVMELRAEAEIMQDLRDRGKA